MTRSPDIAFCGIAVMAKASEAGKAKTRLCPPLSVDEAAAFNTAFLKDIADNLIAAASQASLVGSMAYGPPGSEAFFRAHLPASIALREVWYPNLGACLIETLKGLFAAGHKAACVLNSDSPTLPPSLLVEMTRVLAEPGDRAVFGPSADGGYYLLALKTMHVRLFEDIAWSTDAVARQTLERAAEIGLAMHVLPEWYDVDDCQTIRVLMEELLEGRAFSANLQAAPARHSRALLEALAANSNLAGRLDRFMSSAARVKPSPLAGEGGAQRAPGEGEATRETPLSRARDLRHSMTDAEQALWRILRNRQLVRAKFRRQAPLGPYFADFVCYDVRLIIEADGGQHAESQHDAARDAWFAAHGFQVLRFWNNDILQNPEGVAIAIAAALTEKEPLTPIPSPARGEGSPAELPSPVTPGEVGHP